MAKKKKTGFTEIAPEEAFFKLKKTGKLYKIRKFNPLDEIQITREFGGIQAVMDKVIKEADLDSLLKVIYRQISDADKADFAVQTRETYDDNGNKITLNVGGWCKLAEMMDGKEEIEALMDAFLMCLGVKRARVEESKEKK